MCFPTICQGIPPTLTLSTSTPNVDPLNGDVDVDSLVDLDFDRFSFRHFRRGFRRGSQRQRSTSTVGSTSTSPFRSTFRVKVDVQSDKVKDPQLIRRDQRLFRLRRRVPERRRAYVLP